MFAKIAEELRQKIRKKFFLLFKKIIADRENMWLKQGIQGLPFIYSRPPTVTGSLAKIKNFLLNCPRRMVCVQSGLPVYTLTLLQLILLTIYLIAKLQRKRIYNLPQPLFLSANQLTYLAEKKIVLCQILWSDFF